MKAQTLLCLDVETAKGLRVRAAELGVHISELADLLIRGGFAAVRPAALEAWAKKKTAVRQVAARPRASEAKALSVLNSAWQAFSVSAETAGQSEGIHWRALQGLLKHELVECQVAAGVMRDAKGRPLVSLWRVKA